MCSLSIMEFKISTLFFFWGVFILSTLIPPSRPQLALDKVFILGGATKDTTSSIYNALREATGKPNPNIVVAVSAAPSLQAGLEAYIISAPGDLSYHDLFLQFGFNPSVLHLAIDNFAVGSSANTTTGARNIGLVQAADVIFFNGGDQSRHSRCWLRDDGSDTDIMRVLRERVSAGAVVAGTSAGCAIQGDPTFGSGVSYGYYYFNADLKVAAIGEELLDDREGIDAYRADVNGAFMKGFGFVQDALLDSHFDARGRFGRLAVAMKQSGQNIGFGVDEDSGLYFHNGSATVFGRYGVWVMDASEASYSNETHFAVNSVRISYLSENDTYSFADKVVTSTKELITREEGRAYESNSIFGLDEAYDSITSLVQSTSTESIGYGRDGGARPTARVRFYKDSTFPTRGYYSSNSRLFTVDGLLMDIGTR